MRFSHIYVALAITGSLLFLKLANILPGQIWYRDATYASVSSTGSDPSTAPTTPYVGPEWLLAIFTGPTQGARRSIIRDTWASRYQDPQYEYRFILGNYSDHVLADLIETENRTFGDIWAIEDLLHETAEIANNIKNLELFKYMVQYEGSRLRRYSFVSKVDDDSWLNIPPYFDTFMAQRLPGGINHNPDRLTMIGRPMTWGEDFVYPSGRMYTLSWPLLEYYVREYTSNPSTGKTEDKAMGWYPYQDGVVYEYVPVELEQAWDVGIEHVVTHKATTLLIHDIKEDDLLQDVATLFDSHGQWNGRNIHGLTTFDRNMHRVIQRLGEPSSEEMAQLADEERSPDRPSDPWASLSWKLIQPKISIEDRQAMGNMYPLNLPGNNASTGVIPQRWGTCARPCAHMPDR